MVAYPSSQHADKDEPWRPASFQPLSDPRCPIARAVLKALMSTDDTAVFRRPNRSMPEDLSPYRATAFWPTTVDGQERLYPALRASFGGAVREAKSALYFLKGEAFAGLAWKQMGRLIAERHLPAIAERSNESEWREAWRACCVPDRVVDSMGLSSGYAQYVQSIACIGVKTDYGPIVFCVDAVMDDAFDDANLPRFNLKDLFTKFIPSRCLAYLDFWTWACSALNARFPRGAAKWLLGTVASAVGVGGLAVLWTQAKSLTPMAWKLIALWGHVVVLLILFVMLPRVRDLALPLDTDGEAHAAMRLVRAFVSKWFWTWIAWIAYYVGAALLATCVLLFGDRCPADLPLLVLIWGDGWNLMVSHLLLSCYFCLTSSEVAPEGPLPTRARVFDPGMPGYAHATLIFLLTAAVGLNVAAASGHGLIGSPEDLRLVIASSIGVYGGVVLGLLAGRLNSRLIGAPGRIVAFMFCYASLQPLYPLFSIRGEATLTALAIIPKVALFLIVYWAAKFRAFERYAMNINEIASAAPRRTLSDAWPWKSATLKLGEEKEA